MINFTVCDCGELENWGDMAGDDEKDDEAKRRQKMRSIAIALALVGLVVLFYVATLIRLGGNVLNRPM